MKKPIPARSRLPLVSREETILEAARNDATASLQRIADRLLQASAPTECPDLISPVIVRVDRGDEELVLIHVTTRGHDRLTGREKQVARLVASGLPNQGVARRLGIARATVAAHLRRIYSKLEISSRTELAIRSLAF